MLQKSAKDFLKKEFPADKVRELELSDLGYEKKQWAKISELGWLGLTLPEKYDGTEMTFLDLIVLAEQIGAYLMPGPFFSTIIGELLILESGSNEQKDRLLPKISNGDLILAVVDMDPLDPNDPTGELLITEKTGDGFVIDGQNLFLESAHLADYILIPAKSGKGDDEISIFFIDTRTDGVKINPMPAMGLHRIFEVDFKNVTVSERNLLGGVNKGLPLWESMRQKAKIIKCAEMVGGLKAVLDMTNKYAKKRIAYGNAIGTFQVVQHSLADSWVKTQTSSYITYQTAWKISEGIPCVKETVAAKTWVGKSFMDVTRACAHLHGAIGYTYEHDLGLYFRNARICDLAFGDQRSQLQYMSKEMKYQVI